LQLNLFLLFFERVALFLALDRFVKDIAFLSGFQVYNAEVAE
jgi:hypothetical protein